MLLAVGGVSFGQTPFAVQLTLPPLPLLEHPNATTATSDADVTHRRAPMCIVCHGTSRRASRTLFRAMEPGLTCPRCGARTPLPADLRTPTFPCSRCGGLFETASQAGSTAVSLDAVSAHVHGLVSGAEPLGPMPAVHMQSAATVPRPCRLCGATLHLSTSIGVKTVDCPNCKVTQPVSAYASGMERFAMDMTQQMVENSALQRVRAEGIPCPGCGARIVVPDDGSLQVVCTFCRTPALLADFAPPGAVARARFKHQMSDISAAMDARVKEREYAGDRASRGPLWIGLAVIVIVALVGVAQCFGVLPSGN
jgi:hypothetical protein